MDFSKINNHGNTRSFSDGFVTTVGESLSADIIGDSIPGFVNINRKDIDKDKFLSKCDIIETRPTFILSNDDIFNLGHYSNDVIGIWNMLVLANKNSRDSLLINIDGFREGGPAGGPAHRLMVASSPDEHGPYAGYFDSWFSEVKKATNYGNKRVCFTNELFVPPDPGVAWFWNDWGQINDCSVQV